MTGEPRPILEILERLAPGTPMRDALERILQQEKGALMVLGSSQQVKQASSGGFALDSCSFTPARLAELAKMDGGIVLDDDWDMILAANVHFIPGGSIPTDETGARHRTAERMAVETAKPVVSVSEARSVATLFYDGEKVALARPTEVAARVNQDLQTLDRLRRRLDTAETRLDVLEVSGLADFRSVVTVLQRAELVRRVGRAIERQTITLGEEGRLVWVQLADLLRGVENLRDLTLRDHIRPARDATIKKAVNGLTGMSDADLADVDRVADVVGFGEIDGGTESRGHRLLSKVSRLPEAVRDGLIRQFRTFDRLLEASPEDLEAVDGVGQARATQIRAFFDRILLAAQHWDPDL
ncbi:MAG: DNA integrity scanning protein DisA [Acidimicrobiia bacterium]|nr:DNA integrity scanning protein DisA [Acidimicrobiia bacterium]